MIATLITCLFLGVFTYRMTQLPWSLNSDAARSVSVGAGCNKWGAQYRIEVAGVSYWCGGGDSKCPRRSSELMLFDSTNPSRCRLAKNVQRPSNYELGMLAPGLVGLGFVLIYVLSRVSSLRAGE